VLILSSVYTAAIYLVKISDMETEIAILEKEKVELRINHEIKLKRSIEDEREKCANSDISALTDDAVDKRLCDNGWATDCQK